MAKKNDQFYFDNFIACADLAYKGACLLRDIMENFDVARIDEALARMHEIENEADEKRHEVSDALITAFITPIEREDIAELSESLDVVVDHIEGALHRIYFCNVQEMRPAALKMIHKIVEATEGMTVLVRELPQFRRSKTLREQVVRVNAIEGECDDIFIESMRELHVSEADPLQVIAWRDVYSFLEYCADSCEHVAGAIENIVMKNS